MTHKGFCAEMKDFLHDQKQNGAQKWEIFKFNFVGLLLQICEMCTETGGKEKEGKVDTSTNLK